MPSADLINERHRDEWAEWLTERGLDPYHYLADPVEVRSDVVILQRIERREDGSRVLRDDGRPRTTPERIPYAGRDDLPLHPRPLPDLPDLPPTDGGPVSDTTTKCHLGCGKPAGTDAYVCKRQLTGMATIVPGEHQEDDA